MTFEPALDQRSVLAEIMEALPERGTETLCHSSLYMSSFPFQGAYVFPDDSAPQTGTIRQAVIQLMAGKLKGAVHMYDKIGNLARLKYVLIAILLFLIGLVLMLTFFLMITIPFALAVWAWAGIFLYLAAIGRPYSDFVAALPSIKHKSRNRSV